MSKEMGVIALGLWIIVLPYLGIPGSWRTVLFILTGLALVALGFYLRNDALSAGAARSSKRPFIESEPHLSAGEESHHMGPLN